MMPVQLKIPMKWYLKRAPAEEIPEEELIVSEDEDTQAEAEWHKEEIEEAKPAPNNLMPKFPKKKFLLIGIPIVIVLFIFAFFFLPKQKPL